ncbi:unnamed protein product [Timema podura]|uniref:Uncharacterized protein n=1 Tax=Timema podura TaxID=61482 RepID=A0ABN7ND19_TIMPD|nr:unnamed protein product [Timema podura]
MNPLKPNYRSPARWQRSCDFGLPTGTALMPHGRVLNRRTAKGVTVPMERDSVIGDLLNSQFFSLYVIPMSLKDAGRVQWITDIWKFARELLGL